MEYSVFMYMKISWGTDMAVALGIYLFFVLRKSRRRCPSCREIDSYATVL